METFIYEKKKIYDYKYDFGTFVREKVEKPTLRVVPWRHLILSFMNIKDKYLHLKIAV